MENKKKKAIVNSENPILRKIAEGVSVDKINTEKIKSIISQMKEALHLENDGVAIAAPQIGVSLRIFVVSERAIKISKGNFEDNEKIEPDQVFINPVITKISKKKVEMEEGCLSVRWLYGKIKRSEKVEIEAYDENGKKFKRGGSGLLAQIFQHETDHLNGILFIDNAKEIVNLPPQDN